MPDIDSLGRIPVALTIAGSDPSGGAGIQVDLKTFAHWRVYGLSVVTALTAQNTLGVDDVMDVPSAFVARQLDTILDDIRPQALKTGMLASSETILVVSTAIRKYDISLVVVDPVLTSTSGSPLLPRDALGTLRKSLFPLATVLTPNLDEAAALTGLPVCDVSQMEEAARSLAGMGARNVLVKGGHLRGDAVDVFFDGERFAHLSAPRLSGRDVHGTGCVLSASLTAHLACGATAQDAASRSKEFMTETIRRALFIGKGNGLPDMV